MQTEAQLGGSEGALQQMRPPSVLMAQAPYMLGARGWHSVLAVRGPPHPHSFTHTEKNVLPVSLPSQGHGRVSYPKHHTALCVLH